ncbi:MAG: hypothetical protein Kow0029_07700 [Candidatus Rifleibacteriota bacterium]
MNSPKINHQIYFLIAWILLLNLTQGYAQITDQTINFSTPKLDMVFQPPFRSGFNSEHPLEIELPKLNLAVNLLENYMQYLLKLQKIATATSLQIIYAPEQSSEAWNENTNLIQLKDTGLNHILTKVNSYLSEKSTTDKLYLLDNAETLFNIPDQFARKECKIAEKLDLVNLSRFLDSLEPDTYAAIGKDDVVYSTRPFKTGNRIVIISEQGDVCSASIILGPGNKWFSNLRPSATNEFLAFTEDFEPMVMKLRNKKIKKLFPDQKTLMLSMEWSSSLPVLAGFVLDLDTQDRHFFLYNAEKEAMLELKNTKELNQNYLYSWPYWSPDGKKLILTSGRKINIVDIEAKRAFPNVTSLPNEIAELIWSSDTKSFAVVEIIGQARSKTVFDDFDLRKSILHRFRINDNMSVTEDHAQRIESRNTIKLVSFWTLDRVLYVEGRLISKKLNTPFWDLSKTFSAFLTPPPTVSIAKENAKNIQKLEPVSLPMKYLFVFRNLDGKFKNVYDAGYSHTNHLFTAEQNNLWFIGLRKPEDLIEQKTTFNIRSAPYPFMDKNKFIFSEVPANKMKKFVKFLEDYNLRYTRFGDHDKNVYFLANFCGPLNIWRGNFRQMIEALSENNQD